MLHHGSMLTERVIQASMTVHSALGPGLLESAYQACLAHELTRAGMSIEIQVPLPVTYKGISLDAGYRLDIVVERGLILELKTVKQLHPIHEAQLLSYLRLSGMRVGLLINFHVVLLRDGIKRIVNG